VSMVCKTEPQHSTARNGVGFGLRSVARCGRSDVTQLIGIETLQNISSNPSRLSAKLVLDLAGFGLKTARNLMGRPTSRNSHVQLNAHVNDTFRFWIRRGYVWCAIAYSYAFI
jgi:hypothetical protein